MKKKQRRSKFKSYLYWFVTILSIFRLTFFSSQLPANAKDTCPILGPGQVVPTLIKPSDDILKPFKGASITLCDLALSYGSSFIGAVCGVVVTVGILKAQGK